VRCSPPADTLLTQRRAVVQRVVSTPRGKAYGILSVVSQLYGSPRIAFKIPPTVFQPQPDVDSALIVVDFPEERPRLGINECHLRTVLRAAFQMRRKMLRQVPRPAPAPLRPPARGRRARAAPAADGGLRRQSLKRILQEKEMTLPDAWGTLRPEVLTPPQFVELTKMIFGEGETPVGVDVWRGKLTDEARNPTLSARQEGGTLW
jgi:16S rRNA (adenine1518-N6/adenine1519-N6)-dimethyltransferase